MTKLIPEETRIQQINNLPNIRFVKWQTDYRGTESRAVVKCEIDGFVWPAKVSHLIKSGSGCPNCAGNRRFTSEEYIEKINYIADGKFEFVRWPLGFRNSRSKALCRCAVDGFEWESIVNNIINHRRGCPQCAKKRRWTANEYEKKINDAGSGRFVFVRWDGEFKSGKTKVIVRCLVDGFEWKSFISPLISRGCGCPSCARYGFDKSKDSVLYALRSECGKYVKVGISNVVDQRHARLKSKTPFEFSVIEKINGTGMQVSDLEKKFHDNHESAGLSGFDGATEWLICTDTLLCELRNTRDSLHQGV